MINMNSCFRLEVSFLEHKSEPLFATSKTAPLGKGLSQNRIMYIKYLQIAELTNVWL